MRGRGTLATLGVVCLLAGLTALAGIAMAIYGDCADCQHWAMRLGLAQSLLGSALAQSLIMLGGWMLWRALRRGPPGGAQKP